MPEVMSASAGWQCMHCMSCYDETAWCTCRSSQDLNSPGTDFSMIAPVFETVLSSLTQVRLQGMPHAAPGSPEHTLLFWRLHITPTWAPC